VGSWESKVENPGVGREKFAKRFYVRELRFAADGTMEQRDYNCNDNRTPLDSVPNVIASKDARELPTRGREI
jgi:hypothetical protein